MSQFKPGQKVIYMRLRSATRPAQDIEATYVQEVDFSWKAKRHHIEIVENGQRVNRFVSTAALRSDG